MKALRRVTTNLSDIEAARIAQARITAEDAGEIKEVQRRIDIPAPIYSDFSWGFKLQNLISFYIEAPEMDMISTFAYDGQVRLKYDKQLHDKFDMYLSLFL